MSLDEAVTEGPTTVFVRGEEEVEDLGAKKNILTIELGSL